MKAVFPCTGTVILTKSDVDKLKNFYLDNLQNSKLFSIYNQSNYAIQVGKLNYLPQKSNIILDNAHFLTLQKLHSVLSEKIDTITLPNNPATYDTPIDDNFILNHPFFETLTPLN